MQVRLGRLQWFSTPLVETSPRTYSPAECSSFDAAADEKAQVFVGWAMVGGSIALRKHVDAVNERESERSNAAERMLARLLRGRSRGHCAGVWRFGLGLCPASGPGRGRRHRAGKAREQPVGGGLRRPSVGLTFSSVRPSVLAAVSRVVRRSGTRCGEPAVGGVPRPLEAPGRAWGR